MPSVGKISSPSFSFGDITREEINLVLSQAGVPLTPPKKTPFATGVQRRKQVQPKQVVIQVDNPIVETRPETVSQEVLIEEPAEPVPAEKNAPKLRPSSWAALLKSPNSVAKPVAIAPKTQQIVNNQSEKPAVQPSLPKFTEIINKYEPSYGGPLLQPRGLINNILQPLSHCPPFYNLIKSISMHVVHTFKSKTPLLDSLIEFINEFRSQNTANVPVDEEYGEPFVPEYVYDALRGQKRFDSLKGRQEDAEEFLCFLLDGLHEEMVAVLKEQTEKRAAMMNGHQEGWLEVGPKNKTSSLRMANFDESPISKIFGGKLRSVLRCPGAKDSVNLEPYQSLPLDIQAENVHSVRDAIQNMTVPEIMHDYLSPKGVRVDATKQVFLDQLPPVLVFHLKRFVFDNVGGVQKLRKKVDYESQLTIDPEWMGPSTRPSSPVTYQLFGVVYHLGASAGGGHYTCHIKRHNGEWLHIDDTTIKPVSERDVLVTEENTHTSETAYILFYIRSP
ncbi:hypothetical protein DFQ28_000743 [Apophysomyces sp. BC1034]|nr:hypothetical protein DFQ28_000743 [Apophysomyces sp. BC1034]